MTQGPGTHWLMPADNDLISAIGRAIYNFAQLELCVGHVRRKLCGAAGGIDRLSPEDAVVELEVALSARPWEGELVAKLRHILRRYRELKPRRDRLLCLPQYGPSGIARSCRGEGAPAEAWRTPEILGLAHEFEIVAIEANQVLRRYL